MDYEELIEAALNTPFEGWDFGVFQGRFTEPVLPWSYEQLLRDRLPHVDSLLDLGTGGGELLSSLQPLPRHTAATEGYAPNIPVARRRLAPLGIDVAEVADDGLLPFQDGSFDLLASRHEAYEPREVLRVLTPGGEFITQQVGGRDLVEVNEVLGGPTHQYHGWRLATAAKQLSAQGFDITWQAEATVPVEFRDIGALVMFLRITPWHVPDFTVDRYATPLRALHEQMRQGRPLHVTCDRFALTARRSPGVARG